MRCNDCSKFVSLEMGDPEMDQELTFDEGTVSCTVRIVRTCAECGTDLKGADLEMELELDDAAFKDSASDADHTGEGHDIEIDEGDIAPIEEGGGRYAKSYFGAEVSFALTCSCDKDKPKRWTYEGTISDKIAASAMEELA